MIFKAKGKVVRSIYVQKEQCSEVTLITPAPDLYSEPVFVQYKGHHVEPGSEVEVFLQVRGREGRPQENIDPSTGQRTFRTPVYMNLIQVADPNGKK